MNHILTNLLTHVHSKNALIRMCILGAWLEVRSTDFQNSEDLYAISTNTSVGLVSLP